MARHDGKFFLCNIHKAGAVQLLLVAAKEPAVPNMAIVPKVQSVSIGLLVMLDLIRDLMKRQGQAIAHRT
jgi:hypothetical protein